MPETVPTLSCVYIRHGRVGRSRGGDGWLRLLEFSPRLNRIRVRTYSPTLDLYERDDNSEFMIDYDMRPAGTFALLAERSVDSGVEASVLWSVPSPGDHEWFVEAFNGSETQVSPIRGFTVVPDPGATTGPRIVWQQLTDGEFRTIWTTVAGRVYRVWAAGNLNEPDWVDESGLITAVDGLTAWTGMFEPEVTSRFFRVQVYYP